MQCEEFQRQIFLGRPDDRANAHLAVCVECQEAVRMDEDMRYTLACLPKPRIPDNLAVSIIERVRSENAKARQRILPISTATREWIKYNIFPYAAGAFSSVVLMFSFLYYLHTPHLIPASLIGEQPKTIFIPGGPAEIDPLSLTPEEFAQSRKLFAKDSPSINPKGPIVDLSKAMANGEVGDDEIVVVADVYGNGLAKIATFVEKPRDPGTLAAFERAMESGISQAPFVPAGLEDRPELVRVVFRYQRVNVSVN